MHNREAANTTPHKLSEKSRSQIILSLILYAIPLAFFVVCYFLIITSGEDIYQGANTTPDIIGDSIAAFRYNARLSDMYAWSVINFFDYKYSFGIDTIFRLLDVAMGMGIIYLMTYFTLGRRPRLKISDATWFLFCFVMIFLTPHGRTLYAGFSVIHNYLIVTLSTLIFLLPFIRLIRKQKLPGKVWFVIAMLLAGFVFGFSSNLTPIAFLITFALVMIYLLVRNKRTKLAGWEISGVIGVVVGVAIQYLLGPGVTSYINSGYSTTYDYVSFSQILLEPLPSIIRLIKHAVVNYGRVLLPLLLVLVVCLVIYLIARKIGRKKARVLADNTSNNKLLAVIALFVIVHIAIASQIRFPIRIVLPAYVMSIVCLGIVLHRLLRQLNRPIKTIFTCCLALVAAAITVVRLSTAITYAQKVDPVFEQARESNGQPFCVNYEDIRSNVLPVVYLGQEDMLVDWAMPETIYDTAITFCDLTQ